MHIGSLYLRFSARPRLRLWLPLLSQLALIQLSMHWQVLTGADAPDGTEASGASEVEEECGGNRGKATGLWMKLDL